MPTKSKIRISKEFEEVISYIRAKCLLHGQKCPSIPEITKIMAKNIDKERMWQNGFFKK